MALRHARQDGLDLVFLRIRRHGRRGRGCADDLAPFLPLRGCLGFSLSSLGLLRVLPDPLHESTPIPICMPLHVVATVRAVGMVEQPGFRDELARLVAEQGDAAHVLRVVCYSYAALVLLEKFWAPVASAVSVAGELNHRLNR